MVSCWVNRLLIRVITQGMHHKSQEKVRWVIKLKEQLLLEVPISWEINHNLSKLQITVEVLKKARLLTQTSIKPNNSNHTPVITSHRNQTQLKSVKWCTRLSKIILIWETAYSLEAEMLLMVFKALCIPHIM